MIAPEHDAADRQTDTTALPQLQRIPRENILTHLEFITQFCIENQIATEGLVPNVMLQEDLAMIQTTFVAGGVNYGFLTTAQGENMAQRNGVFDVQVQQVVA